MIPEVVVSKDLFCDVGPLLAPHCSQQLEVLSVKLQLYTFAGRKHVQNYLAELPFVASVCRSL